MRISDWSSDVCSSDVTNRSSGWRSGSRRGPIGAAAIAASASSSTPVKDRKSVVSGTSVSVRVDLGGRRTLNKKNTKKPTKHTHRQKQPDLSHICVIPIHYPHMTYS